MRTRALWAIRTSALGLLFAAGLSAQQAWKSADTLPGVDFAGLTPAQKTSVLKVLREHDCSCGCGMKMAECRVMDPSCSYSRGLTSVIVAAIRQGKSEPEALALANASKFAHAPGQSGKLLDDPIEIATAGSPVIGPSSAPVTMVEFSDFQCPYCAIAAPQLAQVLKAFPKQVKLIFKQFPLETHPKAPLAAAAALAAFKQGKFWEMHDALFARHNDLSRQGILEAAREIGLDTNRFEKDLASTEVHESVVRDMQDGETAGVQGTPTLFINGQRYNGSLRLDALRPVLETEFQHPAHPPQTVASTR